MRFGVGSILLLMLFQVDVSAQGSHRFLPARDLAGYEEASFSEFSYLYELDFFEQLSGTTISDEDLTAVRKRWDRVRSAARTKIDGIQEDPVAHTLHLLERKLRRHHFFSLISYTRHRAFDPVVIYIQELQKPRPGYEQEILERYGPPARELHDRFEDAYALPYELQPRAGHQAYVLFVLSSYGDYSNYLQSASRRGVYTNGAYYDPDLRIAVIYENIFDRSQKKVGPSRRSALYTLGHALLHAHQTDAEPALRFFGLYEGIAESLSRPVEFGQAVDLEDVCLQALRDVGKLLKNPRERDVFILRADELIACRTQNEIYSWIGARRGRLENASGWWGRGIATYQKEAGLLVHFLRHDGEVRYAELFRKALRQAMTGWEPVSPADGVVFDVELGQVHADFVAYLDRKLRYRCPELALSPEARSALLNTRNRALAESAGKDEAGGGRRDTTGPASLTARPFDPRVLESMPTEPEILLGLALDTARRGRIDAALVQVGELCRSERCKGALAEQASRELNRLRELLELRVAFLGAARSTKKKLRINHEGQRIVGVLRKIDVVKGMLLLEGSRGDSVTLPVSAITPGKLAKLVRGSKPRIGEDGVLAYAYLLEGNKLWKKYSRGSDPEFVSLVQDAEDIAAQLELGCVHGMLNELAATGLPADTAAANEVLTRIKELLDAFADDPAVTEREDDLRRLAARVYCRIFDGMPPGEKARLMRGDLEFFGAGQKQVRLTYDFESPGELEDFAEVSYLEDLRENLHELSTSTEESYFKIDGKRLICKGQGCRRLKIELQAPMKISFKPHYDARGYKEVFPTGWFCVGFCDNGFGSGIRAANLYCLDAIDKQSGFQESFALEETIMGNQTFQVDVVHDGQKVSLAVDGERLGSIPAGPLLEGGVYLWVHYDIPIMLRRLEIEGKASPEMFAPLRNEWLAQKLFEIGL